MRYVSNLTVKLCQGIWQLSLHFQIHLSLYYRIWLPLWCNLVLVWILWKFPSLLEGKNQVIRDELLKGPISQKFSSHKKKFWKICGHNFLFQLWIPSAYRFFLEILIKIPNVQVRHKIREVGFFLESQHFLLFSCK